jgi:hypothetical protein
MKKLLLAAAIALLPLHAAAAEAPVKKDFVMPPSSGGITIKECLEILQGLNAIDQHIVIIGKAPNQQTVQQSYEYGGNFRINVLAHNIHALSALQQDAQAEQQRILRGILAKMPEKDGKPATEIPTGTPEAADYDKQLRELTSAPCLADLVHFKEPDLNLDQNGLPAWALSNIEKIRDK